MASSVTRDGATIRIAMRKPWWRLVFALPFFAIGLFFFWLAAMALKDAAAERVNGNIDYFAIPLCIVFGLGLTAPGAMIASRRFLIVDKVRGQVSRFFQVGPFKWRRDRNLAEFNVVSVIWEPDSDNRGGSYAVTLYGDKGTDRVRIDAFAKLPPAIDLARQIGGALGLPIDDDSDVEPDDPDLADETDSQEQDRQPAAKKASAPSRRESAASGGRNNKRYSLSAISIAKGKVGVLLPPPAFVPWIMLPLFALNGAIWWLDWQAVIRLFQLLSDPQSSGLSLRTLALAPVTIAAALPLAAMAGMKEHLVFDKAAREVALVRKSAMINSRRPSPLSSLAKLTIGKRSAMARTKPFAVSFVAEPGSRPRLLGIFETKALARGFADAIAGAAGLQVVESL
jgi:hypothetical protein